MAEAPVVPEITAEVKVLCDVVHELLKGPDGEDRLEDSFETERVCLDIPRAWLVLAGWLAIKHHQRRHGVERRSAFMREGEPGHTGRHVRYWARGYLWTLIHDAMHMELHTLAVGSHPYLRAAPPKPRKEERERIDLDDEIPF